MAKSRNGPLWKSISKLATGAAFGQAIGLLVYPLLTRLYEPAEMGVLAAYTSLVGIVSVAASLRYEQAILLPFAKRDAAALAILSSWVALSVSLVLAGVLTFWPELSPAHSRPNEALITTLVPIGVLAIATYQILNMLALRRSQYGLIGKTRAIQAIAGGAVQVAGGFAGIGTPALVIGSLGSQAAGILSLVPPRGRSPVGHSLKRSAARVSHVARRYRKFPAVGAPSAFMNSAGLLLPAYLISQNFGFEQAGFYSLAVLVLSAPVQLIGRSTAQVFYSEASKNGGSAQNSARSMLIRITVRLALIGAVPALLIMIFGPQAFTTIFGADWGLSGVYCSLLALPYLCAVVSSPAGQAFLVAERQELSLILNATKVLAALAAFGLMPYFNFPLEACLLAFSLGLGTHYILVALIGIRILKA